MSEEKSAIFVQRFCTLGLAAVMAGFGVGLMYLWPVGLKVSVGISFDVFTKIVVGIEVNRRR